MDDARQALVSALGDPLPDGIGALGARGTAVLAAAVVDAQQRRSAATDAAIDHALRHVPWPLRGTARKALVG